MADAEIALAALEMAVKQKLLLAFIHIVGCGGEALGVQMRHSYP